MTSILTKRWFTVPAISLTLILLLLISTPFIIQYLVKQWLLEQGGEEVRVQNVDFNPFTAVLKLEGLEIQVDAETTLSFRSTVFDLAWLPLLHKQVDVQSIELTGFDITIDNRQEDFLSVGGIRILKNEPPTAAEQDSGWLSGIQSLRMHDVRILIKDPTLDLDIVLQHLKLDRFAQWTPERHGILELTGSINGAAIQLAGKIAPLAARPNYDIDLSIHKLPISVFSAFAQPHLQTLSGDFSYDGKFLLQQTDHALKAEHKGKLMLEDLELGARDAGIELSGGLVSFDGTLALEHSENRLQIDQEGLVRLKAPKLALRDQGLETSGELFSLEGKLAVEQSGSAVKIKDESKLLLEALNVSIARPALDIQNQELSVTGNFDYSSSEAAQSLQLTSDIDMQNLNISAKDRKINLLNAATLQLARVQVQEPSNISIQEIRSENLLLAKPPESEAGASKQTAFSRTEKLQIENFVLQKKLVSVDAITFTGHHNQIVRNADGSWEMVRLIDLIENLNEPVNMPENGAPKAATVSTSTEETEHPPETLDINIRHIQTAGNSAISFSDQSVKPPFSLTLDVQELSLDNLQTRQPQQQSPLKLQGKIGKHSTLSLQGTIQPFLRPPGVDLTGELLAMDLPPVSSYTRESLGVILDSGSMDADLKLASENGLLDGKAQLKLYQLQLQSVESKNSLQSKIPVPLNVALDTLRDRHNSIRLEIPIQGKTTDPEFDPSDAISQALANGVKKGALSYLTLALQPYGSLITAARYAGEVVTRVQLNPVEFQAGQSTLDRTAQDYLSKVGQVMKERPNLAVKICGVAVAQDAAIYTQQRKTQQDKMQKVETVPLSAVDEQKLLELANQRAAVIKDYMIDKFQTPATRLVACQPRLDTDKADARPRTDLLL